MFRHLMRSSSPVSHQSGKIDEMIANNRDYEVYRRRVVLNHLPTQLDVTEPPGNQLYAETKSITAYRLMTGCANASASGDRTPRLGIGP